MSAVENYVVTMSETALVTGITGQDGSYLVEYLLQPAWRCVEDEEVARLEA